MRIIAIVGPSGAGKDTVARLLSDETGIPVLISYTTRPMRDDEVNGREHWFVDSCNTPHDMMLAHAVYGGHEYWTEVTQVHDSAIYVINEEALLEMHDRFPSIDIVSIYVKADESVRRERGVTPERMARDLERQSLPSSYYDYRISNNKSMVALKHKVRAISLFINKKL